MENTYRITINVPRTLKEKVLNVVHKKSVAIGARYTQTDFIKELIEEFFSKQKIEKTKS